MSGFEIIGVVFGVLPLIISAIEHYSDIVDPIRTHRKYSSVLQTLVTEINAQRDIFQNECILILSRFVDQHALEDMLKDSKHDLRTQLKHDRDVQEKLSGLIGSHTSQLQGILRLINDSLNDIYEETKNLPDGLERPQRNDDEAIDMKAWRSHVKQKIKLSLRKDYLNQKINDLRNRNQTFLTLCQQIVRFSTSWTPGQTQSEIQSTEKALGKVEKLRDTSQYLYHHLEKLSTCSDHSEHSANLRLCLETTELYFDTPAPPKMSFEMAITYWDVRRPATGYQDPILLAIESTIETTTIVGRKPNTLIRFSEPHTGQEFQPSPIRRQKSADVAKRDKARKAVGKSSHIRGLWKKWRGDEPPTTPSPIDPNPPPPPDPLLVPAVQPPPTSPEPPPQDLSTVQNLCTHICTPTNPTPTPSSSNHPPTTPNNFIGYLAGHGTSKYMIYKHPPPHPPSDPAITLSTLLLRHRRQQSLPKPEKWRLAGALSLAVLLYHSTPWLRDPLCSSSILFFPPSPPSPIHHTHRPSLKHPHLHTTPCPPPPHLPQGGATISSHAFARDNAVKNPTLYHLGLILLELEFEDKVESLVVESQLESEEAESSNPMPAASSLPLAQQCLVLKQRAGTQLGTLYGRIVRMCLDCDFGLGLEEYRLEDRRVQRVFYERVVRVFQEGMPEFERIWEDG